MQWDRHFGPEAGVPRERVSVTVQDLVGAITAKAVGQNPVNLSFCQKLVFVETCRNHKYNNGLRSFAFLQDREPAF